LNERETEQKAAFERAVRHASEQRFDLAEKELRSVLDSDPDEVNALRMLGSLEVATGRLDDALVHLEAAVASAPGFGHAVQDLATAYLRSKRPADAERCLQQYLAKQKADSRAWGLYADALFEQGRAADGRDAQRQAIATDPFHDKIAKAVTESNAGNGPEAEKIYRQILAANSTNVHALVGLASIAMDREVLTDAQRMLDHAVAQSPYYSHVARARSRLAMKQNRYEPAQAAALKSVELGPDSAECWTSLGTVYAWGLKQAEAVEAFQRSLAIKPEQPRVWLSLGHVLKALGDGGAAIAAYRESIKHDPLLGEAWWSLADLKTFEFVDADVESMVQTLDDSGLDRRERDRGAFCFALGKAYEDRADPEQSFSYYAEGNAVRAKHEAFNTQRFERQVEHAKTTFSAAFFASANDHRPTGPTPIFVIGLPRSGSTLVDQILSSHSRVQGTMELPHMLGYVRELGHATGQDKDRSAYPACVAEMSDNQLFELGQRYLDETAHYHQQAPFFVDKMPNNFMHVGLIARMLPQAIFVDTRRHPMGCCFSIFKQNFARGQTFGYRLETLGMYYRSYVELMAHWDEVLPGRVHRVIYENMVDDAPGQIRSLLDHCGLDFEPACIDFYKNDRVVRTASAEQVRQPIYTSAKEHWRQFEKALLPLDTALGKALNSWDRSV
jgi:predicted Zn-dependent protease